MPKSDPAAMKKERNKTIRWVVTIFFVTVFVSSAISLLSDYIMSISGMVVAFVILLTIIFIGIIFDVIGVAVTSAEEKPFHSMAARKVPGAQDSIRLLRSAERVSSICNDVVGDICGVISGTASATIAVQLAAKVGEDKTMLVGLIMSGLVAGLTVGGKAIGKTFAIGSCTKIVTFVGKFLYFIHHPFLAMKKKKK
jgi:Mg2+/Co2+ transporter CorB